MPTKKTLSKKKSSPRTKKSRRGLPARSMMPYGDPIRQAMASGDLQKMRSVAASSRRWLKEIESLLVKLERNIKALKGK